MRLIRVLFIMIVFATSISACGQGETAPPPPLSQDIVDSSAQLKLSKPLARLDGSKNKFIGDGLDFWNKTMRSLKGTPVVAVQWASWCPSCAAETLILAQGALEYRGRVAFIGINSNDQRPEAKRFLSSYPPEAAQIGDSDGQIVNKISNVGRRGLPRITLISARGRPLFTNLGSYSSYDLLKSDIERYLHPDENQPR